MADGHALRPPAPTVPLASAAHNRELPDDRKICSDEIVFSIKARRIQAGVS
jgi:hypothetical protein